MFRNLLIIVAVFGLGWGASFGAGVAYNKRAQPQTAQAAPVQPGQLGQPGAAGGPGAQSTGQGGQARNTVFGTVSRVDGNTIYVTGPNEQQSKVTLTDQTQILKQAPGTPSDITTGMRVTVQPKGQPAADGSVSAAAISLIPEGVAGQATPGNRNQGGQRQGGQQRPAGEGAPGG